MRRRQAQHGQMATKLSTILMCLVSGAILGAGAVWLFGPPHTAATGTANEKKPLYWVAPMDPNYRRDEPGKSPMGMDLIPVYKDEPNANSEGPGTITISPDVVNNIGVRTAQVERKALHSEIVTVGYVRFDEDKLIHIHPRLSGWVEKLYVKAAGDPVKKDQALYALYSPELVNAQEELLLAINRDNKRLIQASEDRLNALQIPKSFITQLKQTRAVKQTVTFYAPQSGVVDNLNIREGFYVQPGTTMLSIGALDPVWVEAEIFERQAAMVQPNDPVTMTLDYLPGKTWIGRVDYIYPTLDSQTRTVRLRLRFDNSNKLLKPNMFAQITVQTGSDEKVLVIPREALIRTGRQDRIVLALGEGSFKSIAVKVGRQDQHFVEILEGVSEGEEVVTSAQFLLDSESSKTSDFKRMHHGGDKPESVWVAAEIQQAMPEDRMVTATHEPIAEWDWPVMTMDFQVAENVDIKALTPGIQLHMQITKLEDGSYSVTGTHIMAAEDRTENVQSARVEGVINAINKELHEANISRGPIAKWGRPAATVDFTVAEDLALENFLVGQTIDFAFELRDGQFVITQLFSESEQKDSASTASQSDHTHAGHGK